MTKPLTVTDIGDTVPTEEVGGIDRMTDRGVAISVFAGAGGLDLGIDQAGFRTAAAVEINDDAADTVTALTAEAASFSGRIGLTRAQPGPGVDVERPVAVGIHRVVGRGRPALAGWGMPCRVLSGWPVRKCHPGRRY